MEWVETTGKTIESAKDQALDQLGVDEQDAEFEVLEQPKVGLFGRVRTEGRVRARVKPTAPRQKEDRRDRRRRGRQTEEKATAGVNGSEAETSEVAAAVKPRTKSGQAAPAASAGRQPQGARAALTADPSAAPPAGPATAATSVPTESVADGGPPRFTPETEVGAPTAGGRPRSPDHRTEGERKDMEVDLAVQGEVAEGFLVGLLDVFGLQARIQITEPEADTLEIDLTGEDLGILIGPKGSTLLAIQDLTRTVVQRRTGATNGRIQVDVAGYRQKRSAALIRFAHQVAGDVQSTGQRTPLEPMSAADRRIVHDAVSQVAGISTISEGEDARRHVVIIPEHTEH